MPLEFQATDAMVFHACNTARSILSSFPQPTYGGDSTRVHPPSCRMDLCVPAGSGSQPQVVNVPSDVIEPVVRFGIALGLVSGWRVRCPDGVHCMQHLVPLEGTPPRATYLAVFYLSRTEKGTHLDDGGLCPGDEHVFVLRAGTHNLFGLRVHMGFVLRKDLGSWA